jgi:hypothetical protein
VLGISMLPLVAVSNQSCICVLGISMLPLSTIYLMNFEIVPAVWYFFSFIFVLESRFPSAILPQGILISQIM